MATQFPTEHVLLYFLCLLAQNPAVYTGLKRWLIQRSEALPQDDNHQKTKDTRALSVAPVATPGTAAIPDPHFLDGFTTLDRRIVFAIVDSVSGVQGSLSEDELDDMISEVNQLNGRRHQGFFHSGFFDTLMDRPISRDLPADNMTRRRWYMAGCVQGLAREDRWIEIVNLYDTEGAVRQLGTAESLGETNDKQRFGPALQAGWLLFVALCKAGRIGEATSCLEAEVVQSSPQLQRELLKSAIQLIRTNRAADARGMLDLLWSARDAEADAEQDNHIEFYLEVKRRRALCLRQLGEVEAATSLLKELTHESDRRVRASALTDIGLIKAGVRRLGELVVPATHREQQTFAESLEKGKADFELALDAWGEVPGGHASFALGVLALTKADFNTAALRLDAALSFFQGNPTVYQYDKTLSLAQLYLGLAICNTLEETGRLPRACELIGQGLAGGVHVPLSLLSRTLEALALVRNDLAVETGEAILDAAGPGALDEILEGTVGLSSVAITNALFRRAADPSRGARSRCRDYRRVVPMLLGLHNVDRARDALDFLEEQAHRDIDRAEFLEMISEFDHYSPAWDIDRANATRIQILECSGRFEEASALLETECHRVLAMNDDHSYDDAVLMLQQLEGYGVYSIEAVVRLSSVVESRSPVVASELETEGKHSDGEHGEAAAIDKTPVAILVVGGNEIQARMDDEIRSRLRATHPHISVTFQHTGWSGNWRQHAESFERCVDRFDGVVLLSLMRTMLGRTIRHHCNVPWRGCGRGGQGAIIVAIFRVVPTAQRRIRQLSGIVERRD